MDASRTDAPFRLGHRRWLDGLRGVAILLVFSFHLHLTRGGFLGVDLFFVLSGFLITCMLVEEWQATGAIRFGRFYLRRALRLLPAFALTLVLAVVGVAVLQPERLRDVLREIPVAALYLTNLPALHGVQVFYLGHTWSLCVEEQFYLLWPVLLYALLRSGLPRWGILLAVGLAIVASAGHRCWWVYHSPGLDQFEYAVVWRRLYVGIDTRADALLVGCLLGLLTAWNLLPRSRMFGWFLRFAAVAGMVMVGRWIAHHEPDWPYFYKWHFTTVALSAAALLACLLVAPLPGLRRLLEFGPLVGIGKISYGLYLFQNLMFAFLLPAGSDPLHHPLRFVLIVASSFGVALLSYHYVERPFLRLKDRTKRDTPRVSSPLPLQQAA